MDSNMFLAELPKTKATASARSDGTMVSAWRAEIPRALRPWCETHSRG